MTRTGIGSTARRDGSKAITKKKTRSTLAIGSKNAKNDSTKNTQSWEGMLSRCKLKRFADGDPTLTPGALRNRLQHPHVAQIELDPSGRSRCKQCGDAIHPKGTLRMGLWLECHKGYRFLCTLHEDCFWQCPETRKLEQFDEIFVSKGVSKEQTDRLREQFEEFLGNKM